MKLKPAKITHAKMQKGRSINKITGFDFHDRFKKGIIALKSLTSVKLTSKQLETFHFTLNKYIKKRGLIHFNIFPQLAKSKKPNEIRMGKGKGTTDIWVCRILAGKVFCEIETIDPKKVFYAIKFVITKLPMKIKILYRK